MKSQLLTVFITLITFGAVLAQLPPEKMNYQGVARDNSGNILANTAISIRLTIHQGTSGGTIVYQESHSLTTNDFGLFTVIIGNGSNVTGTIAAINWGVATYHLQVELDPAGGTSFTDMGASQLLSVPYALYAKGTTSINGTADYIPKFTSSTTLGNSSFLYENATGIAIGNLSASNRLQVNDEDANNNVKDIFTILRGNSSGFGGDGIGSAMVFKAEVGNGAYSPLARLSGIAPYATVPGATGAFNIEVNTGSGLLSGLYINADRAVGIGTASPNNALHVNASSSNAEIQLTTLSTGTGAADGMRLGVGPASVYLVNSENKDFSIGNGSNAVEELYLKADGNVGIGTSSPIASLHVSSTYSTASLTTTSIASGSYGTASYISGVAPAAIRGIASASGTNDVAGVYGAALNSSGGYGVGGVFTGKWYGAIIGGQSGGTAALQVEANGATNALVVNGNFTGTGVNSYSSDAKLKKDVKPIDNALASIMSLKPSAYRFKVGEFGSMQLPQGLHYGVIAQELREVLPELVIENKFYGDNKEGMDYLAVNYMELIPVLIKGMQEQQALITAKNQTIETQNSKIEDLTRRIEKLEKLSK